MMYMTLLLDRRRLLTSSLQENYMMYTTRLLDRRRLLLDRRGLLHARRITF